MGELREGYKQTDIGIIPEDWDVIELRKLCPKMRLGGNYKTKLSASSYPLIKMGNIQRGYISIEKIEYIAGQPNKKDELCYGMLLLNTRNTPDLVGKVAVWRDELPLAYFNSNLLHLECNKNLVSSTIYLNYAFNTRESIERMREIAIGTTSVAAIYSRDLKKYQIIVPQLTEQIVIAEVLNNLDSLIETLEQKIAKKRAIKEGAMQELLTGKKRLDGFSDPWIEIELREDLHFQPGYPFQSLFFNTEHYGIRLIRNRDLKSDDQIIYYSGLELDPFIVNDGDLLVSMDGDFTPTIWTKGRALLNQRVGRVKSSGKWYLRYFYYALIRPLQIIQGGVGATTVKHLSHNDVENIVLYIPPSKTEQQAIAQILTDMDDEIDRLEQERAKYTALKQGAMQKLLTGEIRLVNTSVQLQKGAEIRTIPIAAHIVSGHIVNKLHGSKGWGRTKLQKSMHLVGYCCQLDFGNEYIRNTAGPDDQKLMNHIDSKFKTYRHVRIDELRDKEGKRHYNYTPTPKIEEVEQAFENYPEETQKAINLLLDKIWGMDLTRAEIVSTLYAVWNNRIIKEQPINDDLLLKDFYDWSAHKSDFSPDLVLRGLNYMRDNRIVPVGWGRYIDKK